MLLAAGFAPAYRERALSDPEMEAVRQALDFMLAQAAPYLGAWWSTACGTWSYYNKPAARMMRFFLDMPADAPLPATGRST